MFLGGGSGDAGVVARFLLLELAVVAVGIVVAGAGVGEGGPRAPASTDLSVFAGAAEAAQLLEGELAVVGEALAVVPNLAQGLLADVAFYEAIFVVEGGGQGQAPLDVAVALDADDRAARGAADPERNGAAGVAQIFLRFAEVANIVAGIDLGLAPVAAQLGDLRDHHQNVLRLDAQIPVVRHVARRIAEL